MPFKKAENQIQVVRTTGQLREVLAQAVTNVMNGEMEIDRATALHKLAKNISESLYSETKIAMFRNEVGQPSEQFGALPLGDPGK